MYKYLRVGIGDLPSFTCLYKIYDLSLFINEFNLFLFFGCSDDIGSPTKVFADKLSNGKNFSCCNDIVGDWLFLAKFLDSVFLI